MVELPPRRDWRQLAASFEQHRLDERAYAIRTEISRREKQRKQRQMIAGAVLGVFLVTLGTWALLRSPAETAPPPVRPSYRETPEPVRVDVEPVVTALTPDTRYSKRVTAEKRIYDVKAGALRFESRKGNDKRLVVRVGALTVEDIGTIFTVTSLEDARARVEVLEGEVSVTWPKGRATLTSGASGVFPPEPEAVLAEDETHRSSSLLSRSKNADWRVLAKSGRYQSAIELLNAHPDSVRNRVDDLLLAADVMRFSGEPARAVRYLQTIMERHRTDPRIALAAFTLGRVFLDELGRPLQAARAFAAAQKVSGPLSEKALAREVEAWSRAGEDDRARQAAKRYLHQYPNGDRVEVVRAFGGLDAP